MNASAMSATRSSCTTIRAASACTSLGDLGNPGDQAFWYIPEVHAAPVDQQVMGAERVKIDVRDDDQVAVRGAERLEDVRRSGDVAPRELAVELGHPHRRPAEMLVVELDAEGRK